MTVLIQQTETGRFYGKADCWTEERASALEFLIAEVAVELCHSLNLHGVEIVEEDSKGCRVIHDIKEQAVN